MVCQDWPCWVQALTEIRGYRCTKVFHSDPTVVKLWEHLSTYQEWFPLGGSEDSNVAKGSCPAISGSSEFVQDIIEWYGSESRILVCLNLHHRPPTGFKSHPWVWHLLAHHLCGGVMTGRFWCGTNQGPVTEPIQKDSARRVRHCVKPLHQGKHHPPPPDPDKALPSPTTIGDTLHPGSYLQLTAPRTRFILPSVFSPTRWAVRSLTAREAAICCDVQDQVASLIPETSLTKTSLSTLSFLSTPPAKLLGTFLEMLPRYPHPTLAVSHTQEAVGHNDRKSKAPGTLKGANPKHIPLNPPLRLLAMSAWMEEEIHSRQ